MSSTETGEQHIPILSHLLPGKTIYASMEKFEAGSTTQCSKQDMLNTVFKTTALATLLYHILLQPW